MFWYFGPEWCVVVGNTEVFMGRVIRGQQNIEEALESAFGNVTDVANPDDMIKIPWRRLPQSISMGRKPNRKLIAKYIIVGHCQCSDHNKLRTS